MRRPALTVLAGSRARQRLLETGLDLELFDTFIGASGGPKWLVLSQLDRRLMPRLQQRLRQPLRTIGTSIGAWRIACLAQTDAAAAITRLEHAYIAQAYETKPTPATVSGQARHILQQTLGSTGAASILGNTRIQTHILAARGRGLLAGRSRNRIALGSALTAALNTLSRELIGLCLERVCFHSPGTSPLPSFPSLSVRHQPLTEAMVLPALLASGSIPLLMSGVSTLARSAPALPVGRVCSRPAPGQDSRPQRFSESGHHNAPALLASGRRRRS